MTLSAADRDFTGEARQAVLSILSAGPVGGRPLLDAVRSRVKGIDPTTAELALWGLVQSGAIIFTKEGPFKLSGPVPQATSAAGRNQIGGVMKIEIGKLEALTLIDMFLRDFDRELSTEPDEIALMQETLDKFTRAAGKPRIALDSRNLSKV